MHTQGLSQFVVEPSPLEVIIAIDQTAQLAGYLVVFPKPGKS
jgi:hypothetical protein